jgi:hypothetical protein
MDIIESLTEQDLKKLAEKLNPYIFTNTKKNIEEKNINKTYNVKEISKLTGKHFHTIISHIKLGLLKGNKVGKSFIVTEESLNRYISNN